MTASDSLGMVMQGGAEEDEEVDAEEDEDVDAEEDEDVAESADEDVVDEGADDVVDAAANMLTIRSLAAFELYEGGATILRFF